MIEAGESAAAAAAREVEEETGWRPQWPASAHVVSVPRAGGASSASICSSPTMPCRSARPRRPTRQRSSVWRPLDELSRSLEAGESPDGLTQFGLAFVLAAAGVPLMSGNGLGRRRRAGARGRMKPVRIAITGHAGYLGPALIEELTAAGHSLVGFRHRLVRTVRARRAATHDRRAPGRPACADTSALRGVRRRRPLRRPLQRPARRLPTRDDASDQRCRRGPHRPDGTGCRRGRVSSSPRPAGLYGAHGDDMIDESADFLPVTPYGRSKVEAEAGITELATDSFQPRLPPERHRLWVRTPTPRRSRGQQPDRICRHDRRGVHEERWHPLAPADPHPRHRPGHATRGGPHHENSSTWKRSTSVATGRTTRSATSPRSSSRSSRAPGSGWPIRLDLILRNYRVDCTKIVERLGFEQRWTVRDGVEELAAAFTRIGLTRDQLEGPTTQRVRRIAQTDRRRHHRRRLPGPPMSDHGEFRVVVRTSSFEVSCRFYGNCARVAAPAGTGPPPGRGAIYEASGNAVVETARRTRCSRRHGASSARSR